MDETWYVRIGEETLGPHTREVLESMRATGKISAASLVWREGSEEWGSYGESDLAAPKPPPLPATRLHVAQPEDVPAPRERMVPPRTLGAAQLAPLPAAWNLESSDAKDAEQAFGPLADFPDNAPTPPKLTVNDSGWQTVAPAPWRRYFGRMFDLLLIGAPLWAAAGIALAVLSPGTYDAMFGAGQLGANPIVSSILTCIIVVPFTALMVGLTGTSPGKWIFGTRITSVEGRPIGFREALDREVGVLVSGLALGTPLIMLFTLVQSSSKLKDDGVTKWDERKPWVVTHRPQGAIQAILFIVGLLILTISYALLQAMEI